jgi:hypothetical protein
MMNDLQVQGLVSPGESVCIILILGRHKALDVHWSSEVQSAHVTEEVGMIDESPKQAAFCLVQTIPDDVGDGTVK